MSTQADGILNWLLLRKVSDPVRVQDGASVKATRVYSLSRIRWLFREAHIYGRTLTILKREGIRSSGIGPGGELVYPADEVDEFISMVAR